MHPNAATAGAEKPKARLDSHRTLLLGMLFIGLLLWRSPNLFLHPRFWAEEGQFYYNTLQTGVSPLTLVMRGNYQFITNLICYLATLVPTEWAAHVTTYSSLLVAVWCIILFSRFSIENGWPLTRSAMAVAIFALCAQGYEVYLTSTNVQWLCALSLLFICITSWDNSRGLRGALLYAWVVVCAFSGVPSSIMAPVLLIKGKVSRSAIHCRFGLILAVGAAIQATIIILHPHADRLLSPTALTMTAPWLLQTVASPIFTGGGTEFLIFFLLWLQSNAALALAYIVLSSIAAFVLVASYREAKEKTTVIVLALVWILVPSIQILGALGDTRMLISGWAHGRYFFIGVVCFVTLIGIAANRAAPVVRLPALSLLLMALCAGLYQAHHGAWKAYMLEGPSWSDQVAACEDRRPCQVQAWPAGPDWTFLLQRK
ncbi:MULTISPECIES: hypothetical protein [Ralstonia solanacearum species complex]|uniref:hypothetical protein n=1 Tax=Ralstonia solanacearum species complex TaxID=3116862 RepID=UPI000E584DC9|nr:hypothetical protein [Ralstonia solanacearum]BEU70696.1 hypothetical protein MAFF211271_02510 [Ralstonia pseudosolanacearum]AXV75721.1 hypothetical protein CJO76_01260 [Ralstonia solanacearum]AXV89721.1 hypothetical protein CJO79_01260 [Ralstonia solanacearum]AXW17927.1 hypothetical protein CJO85_01280 [Ralstonia solanacearum]AXW74634.1 hypothetical protein CJO97_01260 [Ralstonia solanacearum]